MSREHIWADWIKNFSPKLFPKTAHSTTYYIRGVEHVNESQIHEGDPASQRLKVVCKKCNSGWMGNIQNQIKPILGPIISGASRVFEPQHHELFATWATMFTIIEERRHPHTATSTQAQRTLFMEARQPFPNWVIFVAAYEGKLSGRIHHWGGGLYPRNIATPSTPVCNTQITTAVIGNFLFQSLSCPDSRVLAFAGDEYAQIFNLRRIWPFTGNAITLGTPIRDNALETTHGFLRAVLTSSAFRPD